jgi:beta-glucosidase
MLPFDYKAFIKNVNTAVGRGEIEEGRIDDAVRRILRAKFAAGLFDSASSPEVAVIGNAQHQALAREAVAKSQVLLKNEESLLPLSKTIGHIKIAGSAADNVGKQSGAWTVEWQGVDGNVIEDGVSILEGIKEKLGDAAVVEYSAAGDFENEEKAEVGIAIVGEKPYAEGWGDKAIPALDDADLEAIKKLQEVSEKVVVVIVSGRPLFITGELPTWQAVVAAWLPGTQGDGVADTLFGDVPYTGKLPLPWPAYTQQLPISPSGSTSDGTPLLFPRGHGLE